ncbi:hypothetical protein LA303_06015 [Candidatus Sulfidibacterium hydrothermale]|uniref:hypothetical protein n=1 Tax=Candidatus Sulfidibacterium hydrothermale TaxID=2875962 RepID=UPI001F0AE110|nr:hypothetical protein [Candidatus Sulfidibacterium hydrothermale]UBM63519.1 hypothetical protein LA303_06015 [Candidatus Sulfidibacterium hydrothermale]
MKKMRPISLALVLLFGVSIFMSACKSEKKIAKENKEKLVEVFCSGPKYETDNKTFRANSVGQSIDQAISKKIALNNARTQLASEIKVTVQSALDNYAKQQVHNKNADLEKNFQSLSREVVNQELIGTRTICEKVTKTRKGQYKTYIAIELASDKVLKSLDDRLSKDEKLKIDYDYEKFKKEFDKALQNMQNQ